jgi:hypothetical protein
MDTGHFEALLVEVRDDAQLSLTEHLLRQMDADARDAIIEDATPVLYAAQAALAVLNPGKYAPTHEGVAAMRFALERVGP